MSKNPELVRRDQFADLCSLPWKLPKTTLTSKHSKLGIIFALWKLQGQQTPPTLSRSVGLLWAFKKVLAFWCLCAPCESLWPWGGRAWWNEVGGGKPWQHKDPLWSQWRGAQPCCGDLQSLEGETKLLLWGCMGKTLTLWRGRCPQPCLGKLHDNDHRDEKNLDNGEQRWIKCVEIRGSRVKVVQIVYNTGFCLNWRQVNCAVTHDQGKLFCLAKKLAVSQKLRNIDVSQVS